MMRIQTFQKDDVFFIEIWLHLEIQPVIVGLEDKDSCCDVEHDLPGHEGLPGELDHRLVGHVCQQVSVELAIALKDLDEELAIVEKVDNPVDGVDDMDDPREVVNDVKKCVFVLD